MMMAKTQLPSGAIRHYPMCSLWKKSALWKESSDSKKTDAEIQEEMLDYIKSILSGYTENIDVYKETLKRWPDFKYNIYKITAKFDNDWTIRICLSGILGAPLETIEVYYKHIRAGGLRFDFEVDDWTRLEDYYKTSVSAKIKIAIQKMESHWYDDRVNHELYPNGLPSGIKPVIKSFRESVSITNPYCVTYD